jgi:pimeloyl-ACP methyl ester carboxylesterase
VDFAHHRVVVDEVSIHVVAAGDPGGRPVLFLHGWPESWLTWRPTMELAGDQIRSIALDLPGVGESDGVVTNATKAHLAEVVHNVVRQLGLSPFVLVGHDIGGMVAYSYLRKYDDVERAVIMDVVLPGVSPWEEVLRNPYLWHFAMHAIPDLPELLVQGHQGAYFEYFYSAIAARPDKISRSVRARYVDAYRTDSSLQAGFDWYRAFPTDAEDNESSKGRALATPLLYLRGEHESGEIDTYLSGLRDAGVTNVSGAIIAGAGHFTQEEATEETWDTIRGFLELGSYDT